MQYQETSSNTSRNDPSPKGQKQLEQISKIALDVFGVTALHPEQIQAIQCTLQGKDLFLNQPTSWGKSICFQLPAVMLRNKGITLVVSPLVSLMNDQIERLESKAVVAACIHSGQNITERRNAIEKTENPDLSMIYVGPEMLSSDTFFKFIKKFKVARLAVDEAHCVSQWGHDFRPAFLRIPEFREKIGSPPISCVTATAPVVVRDDILSSLKIKNPFQISGNPDRPNLDYQVIRSANEWERVHTLVHLVREASKSEGSVLIYCTRVKSVEAVHVWLKNAGISSRIYHAQMDDFTERNASFRMFMDDVSKVLVATSAIGMGVDKPNIRHVIHFEAPTSLEEYYQQAGRAGRDGNPAKCTLLSDPFDRIRNFDFLEKFAPGREDLFVHFKKLWSWLPEGEKNNLRPVLRIWKNRDEDETDQFAERLYTARNAMLEEFGLIQCRGQKIIFLKDADQITHISQFPISKEIFDAKYSRNLTKLLVMEHYAKSPDPRQVIIDHFAENSVVELVANKRIDYVDVLDDSKMVEILKLISAKDWQLANLHPYLRGLGKKLANDDSDTFGMFKDYNPYEVKGLVEVIVNSGFLHMIKAGDNTVLSLSKTGRTFLYGCGIEPPPIESAADLMGRIHSVEARLVLKGAIMDWFDTQRVSILNPKDWWDSCTIFRDETFTFFGKEISGQKLVETYFGRTYNRSKTRNPILSHTKEFLNHIFDNRIRTEK